MKGLITLLFVFSVLLTFAQRTPLQQVADAENAFAGMSKEKNTRDAFVEFLSDSAFIFAQGNPVLGKAFWEKLPANNKGLLFWWPLVTDVSASGDFGYNTGPFESGRRGEQPAGFGYFSSVWKKGSDGFWKVAIDMGIGLPGAEEKRPEWRANTPAKKTKGARSFSAEKKSLLDFDKTYVETLNKKSVSLIEDNLAKEARVHRTGYYPLVDRESIRKFDDGRENYSFEHLGGDIASSADLAYTYGRVKAVEKKDKKEVTLNYMRIYKKEDGKNWKIVLDVIGG